MADSGTRRARAKAWTAEVDAARRRAGLVLSEGLTGGAAAMAEVAPGRLLPWLPVAFGLGIVLYFTADREPAAWAAIGLALGAAITVVLARERAAGFALALAFAAISTGFVSATLRTRLVAHPVLQFPVGSAAVSEFVETREERERSDRITLRVQQTDSVRRLTDAPQRVRLAVRKGTAPPVGRFHRIAGASASAPSFPATKARSPRR